MEARAYYSENQQDVNISTTQRVISVASGAYLLVSGLSNITQLSSIVRAMAGGYLLYRGSTGYCPITEALDTKGKALNIRETFVINKPRHEVYALWRSLEKLPAFLQHLNTVTVLNNNRSHWELKVPGGLASIGWDAEILVDKPNQELSWRSLPGSSIENSGKLVFESLYGGRSTEIQATITYTPPAGEAGKVVASLFNGWLERLVKEDLKRFKRYAEGDASRVIDIKTTKNGLHV